MQSTGPEVEAVFTRDRLRRVVVDLRKGWLWIALLLAAVSFSLMLTLTPRRSLGVENAEVVGGRVLEREDGSSPYADLRLENGSVVTVRVPRGILLPNGSTVRVESFERTWPWQRTTYQYVARVADGSIQ